MSRKLLLIFTVIIFLNLSCVQLYSEIVNKVLVIVNDEVITQGELDRMMIPVYNRYKNYYKGARLAEELDKARKELLKKLIEHKLLLSEAKRRKIEVKREEIDAMLKEAKSKFPGEDIFDEALKNENMTLRELEKHYREKIMVDKLLDIEIRRRVFISPSEVLEYYNNHKKDFKEPEKIKLRAILIRINKNRSEEEALELAKELLHRIEEGGDFALLAKAYSEGPYKDNGGNMGWVVRGELMKKLDELAFNLEKGEVSGILKTKLGFHILKVEDKKSATSTSFEKVKDNIERCLFNKKVNEKLDKWLNRLKKNAYIAFR